LEFHESRLTLLWLPDKVASRSNRRTRLSFNWNFRIRP